MNPAMYPGVDPKLLDKSQWTDRVTVDGIFEGGFVTSPFALILDPGISESSYMLFNFFVGLASSGSDVAPTVSIQRKLLGWGKDKYYSAREPLVKRGLLSVYRGTRVGGQWTRNTYTVHPVPLTPDQVEAERIEEERKLHGGAGSASPDVVARPETASRPSELNSTQNAVFHNPQVRPCPGYPDTVGATDGAALVGDSGKLEKAQVAPCPGQPDTVHPDTIIDCNFIHTPNSIQPDPRETSRIETAPEARSVPARSDGRMDGARGTTAESNHVPSPHVPSPAPATDAEAEQGWAELSRSSVNRNLIRDGKRPYFALLALGYSIAEIQHAWDRRQDAAKRAGRGSRYYPQLKKWLESDGDDGARMSIERFRSEGGGSPASRSAPRSLSALASRDEAFGRIYWAYCDARQKANQAGVDPERDAECVRLKADMDAEWDAARKRLSAQIE